MAAMHMSNLTAAFAVLLMRSKQQVASCLCVSKVPSIRLWNSSQSRLAELSLSYVSCFDVCHVLSLLQDDTLSAAIFATFASAYNCSPCRLKHPSLVNHV